MVDDTYGFVGVCGFGWNGSLNRLKLNKSRIVGVGKSKHRVLMQSMSEIVNGTGSEVEFKDKQMFKIEVPQDFHRAIQYKSIVAIAFHAAWCRKCIWLIPK